MLIYPFVAGLVAITLAFSPTSAKGEFLRFRLLPCESQILTRVGGPFGGPIVGRLSLHAGEAQGDPNDLRPSVRVKMTIEATSYNSGIGLRDQDVQENYLHVKDYPVITFTSSGVEDIREPNSVQGPWQFKVKGILELHGVKREIFVPVRALLKGKKIIVEGNVRLRLRDYQISPPTLFFFFRSGEDVEVDFRFVGEQQP